MMVQNQPMWAVEAGDSKPTIPPVGISRRPSLCRPYHEVVLQGIETGLTAQRIFQDLRIDHHFTGAYDSVKCYVRRLTVGNAACVERMECLPGEEAQVDFGLGALVNAAVTAIANSAFDKYNRLGEQAAQFSVGTLPSPGFAPREHAP